MLTTFRPCRTNTASQQVFFSEKYLPYIPHIARMFPEVWELIALYAFECARLYSPISGRLLTTRYNLETHTFTRPVYFNSPFTEQIIYDSITAEEAFIDFTDHHKPHPFSPFITNILNVDEPIIDFLANLQPFFSEEEQKLSISLLDQSDQTQNQMALRKIQHSFCRRLSQFMEEKSELSLIHELRRARNAKEMLSILEEPRPLYYVNEPPISRWRWRKFAKVINVLRYIAILEQTRLYTCEPNHDLSLALLALVFNSTDAIRKINSYPSDGFISLVLPSGCLTSIAYLCPIAAAQILSGIFLGFLYESAFSPFKNIFSENTLFFGGLIPLTLIDLCFNNSFDLACYDKLWKLRENKTFLPPIRSYSKLILLLASAGASIGYQYWSDIKFINDASFYLHPNWLSCVVPMGRLLFSIPAAYLSSRITAHEMHQMNYVRHPSRLFQPNPFALERKSVSSARAYGILRITAALCFAAYVFLSAENPRGIFVLLFALAGGIRMFSLGSMLDFNLETHMRFRLWESPSSREISNEVKREHGYQLLSPV